jgi:hypothetical protein
VEVEVEVEVVVERLHGLQVIDRIYQVRFFPLLVGKTEDHV